MNLPNDIVSLAEARRLRNDALGVVRADIALLQDEASPRRIRERAVGEAVEMFDTAREVAGENKAVVAATLAALVGWMLRGPIVGLAHRLLGRDDQGE